MTPFKNYTPTQKMIEIVSVSVDKILKQNTELDDDQRIDICIDICDEILRVISHPEFKPSEDEK
jgi:hypothetical protein|tara:strand:- start:3 stop:194 length:192 start_codon:yes stop_codon:yes gene_type:complete